MSILNYLQTKLMFSLNHDQNVVLKNIFYLFIDKIVIYAIPLITFPYLVHTLGITNFGLVVFVQSIITYFDNFISYGFALTATNAISKNMNNKPKINSIFCTAISIKILLTIISIIILSIIIYFSPKIHEYSNLYFVSILFLIGNAINPLWLFQGQQKMKFITLINVIARSLSLILIFLIVKNENDYFYAVFSTAIGAFIAGNVSFFLAIKQFDIKLSFPSFKDIKIQLTEGFYVFLSGFSVIFYTSNNKVILGILLGNTTLGFYAIAEKIYEVIYSFSTILNQAVFPYLAQLHNKSKIQYINFIKRFSILIFSLFLIISIFLAYYSELIISLVSKNSNGLAISSQLLTLLCIALPIAPFGSLFTQIFIIEGLNQKLFSIIVIVALVNLAIIFPLIYLFGVSGMAIACILVTLLMTSLGFGYLKLNKYL